jgi:phosphatidate cytidylyltransferase
MLRTRLWMGAILVALTVGVLVIDQRLAPWYPFLFVLLTLLAGAACYELLGLLPEGRRPSGWFCYLGILAMAVATWAPHVGTAGASREGKPWAWIALTFAAVVVLSFLVEMYAFQEPGESVSRIALKIWVVAYLGLLPCCFAQLRWLQAGQNGESWSGADFGTLALALAIFVPKCGDIGAYFTGRILGRHPMSPVLSPKKTWEGAAGGMATAIGAAVGINRLGPVLPRVWGEIGFGLAIGIAGMLGDLAESLIKRDCRQKDASQVVPGFGGVLDVVDSILIAAPVAYIWLWIVHERSNYQPG